LTLSISHKAKKKAPIATDCGLLSDFGYIPRVYTSPLSAADLSY